MELVSASALLSDLALIFMSSTVFLTSSIANCCSWGPGKWTVTRRTLLILSQPLGGSNPPKGRSLCGGWTGKTEGRGSTEIDMSWEKVW